MESEVSDHQQPWAAAKSMAADILSEQGVETAPVPVEEIVKSYGVRIELVPMVSDGSLNWRGEAPQIRVNSRNGDLRRRFTLAHELGHLIWRRTFESNKTKPRRKIAEGSSRETSWEERFCDVFAAHLLVPVQDVSWLNDWGSLSLTDLEEAAERFRVSFQTLLWRTIESGPGDAGAVLLESDSQLRTGLRVRWAVFPKNPGFRYRKGEIVPFSADLHRAWKEGGESFMRDYPLKVGNFADDRDVRTKLHGGDMALAVLPKREK